MASAVVTPVHVGYVDESERFVCASCWVAEVKAGCRATRVLDDEEENGPGDNFWIVDECARCRSAIKYMDVKLLT